MGSQWAPARRRGQCDGGQSFAVLEARATLVPFGSAVLRVASLRDIMWSQEGAGRPPGRAMLPSQPGASAVRAEALPAWASVKRQVGALSVALGTWPFIALPTTVP